MGKEDLVHIYTMEYYSAIKRSWVICRDVDGPETGEKQILYIKAHMWNLEKRS